MKHNLEKIIDAAINSATTKAGKNEIENVRFYNGYSEPGYSAEIVAIGNWNKITEWNGTEHIELDNTMARLGDVLEKIGVEIEWEDEWSSCCECDKLVRTQADSHSWKPSYKLDDYGFTCINCLLEDAEAYLESLEDRPDAMNTFSKIKPEDFGYVLYKGDLESGFYSGQTDSPYIIAKELRAKNIFKFIFNLDSVDQFDAKFSCWIKEENND